MTETDLAEQIQNLVDEYRKKLGAFAKIEEVESDPKFIAAKEELIKKFNGEKTL